MTNRSIWYAALVATVSLLLGGLTVLAATPTSITVAGWGNQDVWNQVIQAFEDAHPDIKVDLQLRSSKPHHEKLVVEMASNVAPDVFLLSWAFFRDFVVPGALLDLDPYIERDNDEVLIEDYFPAALGDSNYQGDQYGLPWYIGGRPLAYNADLLSSAGLAIPSANWTWDEWRAMAEKATVDRNGDGSNDLFGFPKQWTHYAFWSALVFSNGGEILNKQNTGFNLVTEPVRKSFRFISDLVNEFNVVPRPGESGKWTSGNFAFMVGNAMMVGGPNGDVPFEYGMQLPPKGDAKQVMIGGNLPLSIWSGSPNKEAAWEFVKFAASPKMEAFRANIGYSPVGRISSFRLVEDKQMRNFAQFLPYQVSFTDRMYDDVRGTISQSITDYVEKKDGLEAILTNANHKLNVAMQESGLSD